MIQFILCFMNGRYASEPDEHPDCDAGSPGPVFRAMQPESVACFGHFRDPFYCLVNVRLLVFRIGCNRNLYIVQGVLLAGKYLFRPQIDNNLTMLFLNQRRHIAKTANPHLSLYQLPATAPCCFDFGQAVIPP